jgi:hypothetical protein
MTRVNLDAWFERYEYFRHFKGRSNFNVYNSHLISEADVLSSVERF